jgi:hypothetical protein
VRQKNYPHHQAEINRAAMADLNHSTGITSIIFSEELGGVNSL